LKQPQNNQRCSQALRFAWVAG